jgi:hypothetical protein
MNPHMDVKGVVQEKAQEKTVQEIPLTNWRHDESLTNLALFLSEPSIASKRTVFFIL